MSDERDDDQDSDGFSPYANEKFNLSSVADGLEVTPGKDASKSWEDEQSRPFVRNGRPMPLVRKDHPDRGAEGAIPPEDDEGDEADETEADADIEHGEKNTYNLPTGAPIRLTLIKFYREQAAAVLGRVREIGAPIPAAIPKLTDWNDPMATAMTPLLGAYWDEAGKRENARLGLDPDDWRVTNPHLEAKIREAAYAFCDSTNRSTTHTLHGALNALRESLVAGQVEEGETLNELTKRVNAIFTGLTKSHANMIAATEASRAVHAAQEQAAIESGVVQGFELLLSSDACPLCRMIATECKQVKLGQAFAVIGDNPHYRVIKYPPLHPRCQCTMTSVLAADLGGPEAPEWGETLDQPDPEKWTPSRRVPRPEPERVEAKAIHKYNPNHDSHTGQFSSGHGAGGAGTGKPHAPHVPADANPDEPGLTLAQSRKRVADNIEKEVARATGGEWMTDNDPSDVRVAKPDGGHHQIEVKSKTFGDKKELSVHPGALMTKIDAASAHPKDTWHTVLIDRRHSSEGGAHAGAYSGHEIYYKRAAGRYTVASMHKCKDMAELHKLINTPDDLLPPAARGEFPKGDALNKLRTQAAEDRAKNNARSAARKQRLGRAAYKKSLERDGKVLVGVSQADAI